MQKTALPTTIIIVDKDVKSRSAKEHNSKQSTILRVFSSKRNEKFSAVHSLRPEKQDGIVHQLFTHLRSGWEDCPLSLSSYICEEVCWIDVFNFKSYILSCLVGLPPASHRNMLGNLLQNRLHVKLQMFSFFYWETEYFSPAYRAPLYF